MKKTLIASATAFAIVLSAGMSMAGPLRGHDQFGFAQNVRASGSQTRSHADRMANGHAGTKVAERSIERSSQYDPGQKNLSSTQQQSTYGTNWSAVLPSVAVITIEDNGSYTWVIGQTSGDSLTDQLIWMNYR